MKTTLAAVSLIAALTAPSFALAAQAMDMIARIDSAARTVTLVDGSVYNFSALVDLSMLRVGEIVVVMYTTDDGTGQNKATAIYPAN